MSSIGPGVRPYRPSERRRIVGALGRAFDDDPAFAYLFTGRTSRRLALEWLHGVAINSALASGGRIDVAGDGAATCIWYPDDAFPPPRRTYLRLLAGAWHLPTLSIPRAVRALATIQRRHPEDPPHLYVEVLGVDPASQGAGLGGALLGGVCDRADSEGLAVYLETTKAANVAYYGRFGFEIHGEASFRNGPRYWLMMRPTR